MCTKMIYCRKIVALTLLFVFIIGLSVTFAIEKDSSIKLSGIMYYSDIAQKFGNNILQMNVDKNTTAKVSIDIELMDESKADNFLLITRIIKKDGNIENKYVGISSDDLKEIIDNNNTIKAYIKIENFSHDNKKINKNLDITFFEVGEYIIDFYVCEKDKSKEDDISDGGTSKRKKRLPKRKLEIFDHRDIHGYWAHDCITALLNHGIIKGYPDNTIRPENFITRAEMAVVVSNALFLEPKASDTLFLDELPIWAKNQIIELKRQNVFRGYPNGKFYPEKYITREQAVAVLVRAFCKESRSINTKILFKDMQDISPWARDYVSIGVCEKILTGYPDNTFKPKSSITRGEVFTIICKLLGYHEEHNVVK